MKPTQESINEIFDYLNSFKDGRRPHNQIDVHTHTTCGTSHCLAGWVAYDDTVKATGKIPTYNAYDESFEIEFFIQEYKRKFPEAQDIQFFYELEYAQHKWGLTEEEADMLFMGDLTLDQMFANAAKIADTHGLWVPA